MPGRWAISPKHSTLKSDPRQLQPEAQSVIVVGLNYAQLPDPALRADPSRGQIASYALGDDYHRMMRKALIELDGWLRAQVGRSSRGRVFVDSAPMLERSWAMQAGIGFIGKNTCLINPGIGSWLFLGGLIVPEVLIYDEPPVEEKETRGRGAPLRQTQGRLLRSPAARGAEQQATINSQHPTTNEKHKTQYPTSMTSWHFADGRSGTCGQCVRCLDVCPTGALVSPFELDARRCISYLTIELRNEIPVEYRSQMGNWVFGCDLCQDVCPWNRRAPATRHPRLQPHPDRIAPPLLDLLTLNQEAFADRFRGSAVKRAKWVGFMRNVCVATGNWGDPVALPELERHLYESPAPVASPAAWALGQLRDGAGRSILQRAWERCTDHSVKASIAQALK